MKTSRTILAALLLMAAFPIAGRHGTLWRPPATAAEIPAPTPSTSRSRERMVAPRSGTPSPRPPRKPTTSAISSSTWLVVATRAPPSPTSSPRPSMASTGRIGWKRLAPARTGRDFSRQEAIRWIFEESRRARRRARIADVRHPRVRPHSRTPRTISSGSRRGFHPANERRPRLSGQRLRRADGFVRLARSVA